MLQIIGITPPPGLKSEFTDSNGALNVGGLVSRLLVFAIVGAGLFFFVRLIFAGYSMMTSLGESGKTQAASKEITNAVIGLATVISAFFIIQIIQVVLGLNPFL